MMRKFKYIILFALFMLGIVIAWNGGCARVVEPPKPINPSVLSVVPANGATNIGANSVITASFSKLMGFSTINASTFTVSSSEGSVSGSLSFNNINYSTGYATDVTFTPANNLALNTNYTVIIAGSVRDNAGNQMGSDYTWSFKTSAAASAWRNVGNAGFSAGDVSHTSLAADGSTLYIAYSDGGNSYKATVQKFNGTSWESVGSPGFSTGRADYTSLFIYSGTPYIAYKDLGLGNQVVVKKFNGSTWEDVGDPGSSNEVAWDLSFSIYNGTPYVAFMESAIQDGTVIKYSGGTWEVVGARVFASGGAGLSIAVDNGIPYLAYSDNANGYKVTVRKYNTSAATWEAVGTPGFSTGIMYAGSSSLKFYNGTPYIGFGDHGINYGLARVMKFDGSNWVNVGSAGFSAGSANYNSLVFDNGTPYLAFADGGNNDAATVMKFDGSSWVNVGNAGFSPGRADYTSMIIVNGIPYVGFMDYGNGKKATVMKYTP